jgi:hypothetical protein
MVQQGAIGWCLLPGPIAFESGEGAAKLGRSYRKFSINIK